MKLMQGGVLPWRANGASKQLRRCWLIRALFHYFMFLLKVVIIVKTLPHSSVIRLSYAFSEFIILGLQYYSLLPWKWTWGHKSRVMTSLRATKWRKGAFFFLCFKRPICSFKALQNQLWKLSGYQPPCPPSHAYSIFNMLFLTPSSADHRLSIHLAPHSSPRIFCRSSLILSNLNETLRFSVTVYPKRSF